MLFKNSTVDQSEPRRHPARFRFWLIVISMIVSVVVVTVVVAIAIQHHNDRLLSAQLIQSELELQTTGARTEWVDVVSGLSVNGNIEVFGDLKPGDEVIRNATDAIRPAQQVKTKLASGSQGSPK